MGMNIEYIEMHVENKESEIFDNKKKQAVSRRNKDLSYSKERKEGKEGKEGKRLRKGIDGKNANMCE